MDEQLAWIEEHRGVYPAIVALNEDDTVGAPGAGGDYLLGFALLSPFRNRPAYSTTVENSVYVHRDARGRGVGEFLLRALITQAADLGYHSLIARIVGENDGSIRLHEKCGFVLVGTEIEVGRKHGRWLDVVEYQYVVPESR
jgi:phosphinothricin acetyltransferase